MSTRPHPATPQCAALEEDLAELALGTLNGRERAAALAHLQSCAACRAEVEQLSVAVDSLLQLAPEADPPRGFEMRLWDRLAREAVGPGREGGAGPDEPADGLTTVAPDEPDRRVGAPAPAPAPGRRRANRLLAIAAAVVIAAAVAFGAGWALSSRHGAPPATAAAARGPLSADGHTVGQAAIFAGRPARITMTLDYRGAYGTVTCEVVLGDGHAVRVGTFWLTGGHGSWSAPLPVAADQVRLARVVTASDTVLATARLSS